MPESSWASCFLPWPPLSMPPPPQRCVHRDVGPWSLQALHRSIRSRSLSPNPASDRCHFESSSHFFVTSLKKLFLPSLYQKEESCHSLLVSKGRTSSCTFPRDDGDLPWPTSLSNSPLQTGNQISFLCFSTKQVASFSAVTPPRSSPRPLEIQLLALSLCPRIDRDDEKQELCSSLALALPPSARLSSSSDHHPNILVISYYKSRTSVRTVRTFHICTLPGLSLLHPSQTERLAEWRQ